MATTTSPITTIQPTMRASESRELLNESFAHRLSTDITTVTFADSPYDAPAVSGTFLVDATGGAVTINLPPAADAKHCKQTFVKTDASGNAVTLDGDSAETVDWASTKVLSAQGSKATILSDETQWISV